MKRLWVVLSLVLVATLALPLSAAAAGSHDVLLDGRIVFGGSFTLASRGDAGRRPAGLRRERDA